MSDENQKKPEIPHRMSRVAWPKAKYGLIIAFTLIFIVLFILYKDVLFDFWVSITINHTRRKSFMASFITFSRRSPAKFSFFLELSI